ncbi:hypothetical protein Kisp01_38120 [Kineosporia sp. NBRC 101677]|uniref:glutamate-cysteine ligase family protein n=1 Tax=Kineosporia TaxID=49184 RepID=UPI0022B7EF70|nr:MULTISPECIES: glutamate-cysteine ligase family protein [Kineosporia]GLY16797.1 hypothetical protein Kisp01_38120 [Kineosporia sp. NBRC 101677]
MSRAARRTVGVEEEFLLLDNQGVPTPAAPAVIALAGEVAHGELHQEQIEIASRPAADLDVIAADLLLARQQLAEAAAGAGVRVAASATSPLRCAPPPHPMTGTSGWSTGTG